MKNVILWEHENAAGEEITERIPAVWEICSTCSGAGQHSLAIGAITADEWARDWSFEEQEDYLNGAYDRSCEECNGSGKILVPAWDRMPKDLAERYETHLRDEAEYDALVAAERRMGA